MKYSSILFFLLIAVLSPAQTSAPQTSPTQDNPDNQPHIQPKDTSDRSAKKPIPKPKKPENAPQTQADLPFPGDAAQPAESSSKDSQIDFKAHPASSEANASSIKKGVSYPYDPHRAGKDVEVGQFYLKHKNYRAALDRFNDALLYKPGDAEATFGLAQTQEKMDLLEMAYKSYKTYLEILPSGPMAKQADAAIRRIEPNLPKGQQATSEQAARALKAGEDALAHNNFEYASQRLEEALRLDAQNPVIYFRLAQAMYGLQRLDPARSYFQKYLELQPGGPFAAEAKREIGEINLVLGKS